MYHPWRRCEQRHATLKLTLFVFLMFLLSSATMVACQTGLTQGPERSTTSSPQGEDPVDDADRATDGELNAPEQGASLSDDTRIAPSNDTTPPQRAGHDEEGVTAKPSISGPGTLDSEVIDRIARRYSRNILRCFQGSSDINRDDSNAPVIVSFTISAKGDVTAASTINDSATPGVGDCIANEIRGWRFPVPDGGEVVVVRHFQSPTRNSLERSEDDISKTIDAHMGQLKSCFSDLPTISAAEPEMVVIHVRFFIKPSGSTAKPEVVEEAYRETQAGVCLVKQIREMKFAPHDGHNKGVQLPIAVPRRLLEDSQGNEP